MIKTRPRGPRSKLSPLYYLIKIEVIYPIKRAKIKLNSETITNYNIRSFSFEKTLNLSVSNKSAFVSSSL